MTPERQQTLYNRYPTLFRERHLPQHESGMRWGLDCPDHWAPIIDAFCATIMQHSTYAPHPVPAVKRVKAKAGSLRLQLDLTFECEFCRGAVEMARTLSGRFPAPDVRQDQPA
jgi:hypothetical protein